MIRFTLALATALLLATLVSACGVRVHKAGPHTVQTRSVAAFDRLEVHGSPDVVVRRGPTEKLTVEGGENVVDDVETRVESGTLVVKRHDSSATIDIGTGDDDVKVTVQTPSLVAARVDGSGDLSLPELHGGRLELTVNGSSDVDAHGSLDQLDASVDGSGDLGLDDVDVQAAKIKISGSGDAGVHAERTLHVAVDGSGNVHYTGHPTLTKDVSGSGDVSPR